MPRNRETPASQRMGADGLKAKFDASGIALHAGVEPSNAAPPLGLEGVGFNGPWSVLLRNPNSE